MFKSTTGFIHVKDYYSSNSERITPCSSTDYYEIQSTNIQIPRNLSISTAHLILDYFEKYKSNPSRLFNEWQDLEADNVDVADSITDTYCLKVSYLVDYNPTRQMYVLQKIPDFTFCDLWSYVWSQNITKMVLLKNCRDDSASVANNYWPDEGSILYNDFEVSTVSIHLCPWYTTRNFFLKNILTNETRSVTQFHFQNWPTNRETYQKKQETFLKYLLQFRREFRASFSDKQSPLLIQSDDNLNRNGCFVVLDSILNRLLNGVREIDIQANVEYFREQCPGMMTDFLNYEIIFDAVSTEILQICHFRID